MKVYGNRILGSGLRFAFETNEAKMPSFESKCIDELNRLVEPPVVDGNGGPLLIDAIGILGRFVGALVKVSLEVVKEQPYNIE